MRLSSQRLSVVVLCQILFGACARPDVGQLATRVVLLPGSHATHTFAQSDTIRCGRPARARWVISADSVGPISLGATFEDLRAMCPGVRDSVDALLHKFAALVLPGFNGRVWIDPPPAASYSPRSLQGSIWSVVVEAPDVRTTEGLGVGSTLQDLRRRFGSMFVIPWPDVGVYVVPRANPRTSVLFFLDGFDPERVPGGWAKDTAVYSDSVTGSAVVRRLLVRPPRGR